MNLPTPSSTVNLNATYPAYIVDSHAQLLMGSLAGVSTDSSLTAYDAGSYPYNALSFVESAVDNNPYTIASAYDPDDVLTTVDTAIDDLKTIVDAYMTTGADVDGEQAILDAYITKAAALYASHGSSAEDAAIEAEVTAFEQDSEAEYLRSRNAFEGSLFDINAVDSNTPYLMGLALLSGDRIRALNRFRAEAKAQAYRDKNVFIIQLAQMMLQAQTRNVGLQQTIAAMRGDQARFRYTSKREEAMQNVEYDVGEIEWELEVLKTGISAVGAMQGMPTIAKKPSNLATAVSTALSIGPQVGLAIGNATGSPALGLLGGGLAAMFSYGANINGN